MIAASSVLASVSRPGRAPLRRALGAAALALLPACFGTGVTPATQASLFCADALALRRGTAVALVVENVDRHGVVAHNVRLRLGAAEIARAELQVDADPGCAALAAGETCTLRLTAGAQAAPEPYVLAAQVVADNAAARDVTLGDGDAGASGDPNAANDNPPLSAVVLADATLYPPVPATAALQLHNTSAAGVTVRSLAVDNNAGLVIDTSSCTGYPRLEANATCAVTLRASGSAAPGAYVATLLYAGAYGAGVAAGNVVVAPGPLVVNEGAPVTLDANSTITTVRLRNAGFDVANLALTLPWSDTCRGQPSLTLATTCPPYLPAGGACEALLSTLGATPGASSELQASATQGSALVATAEPVQVGSLQVRPLRVVAPGLASLVVVNLGTAPASVRSVRVGGNAAGGLPAPSATDLQNCSSFLGSCTVPVQINVDAWVEGGLSTVEVSYEAGGIVQRAVGGLELPPTQVSVNANNALSLGAGVQTVQVTLTNQGPFAWVSPDLSFAPPLRGAHVTTNCGAALAPGASCNANVTTDATTQYGATSSLVPAGANAVAPVVPQATVASPVLLVGGGTDANAALVASYDAGATWHFQPDPPHGMTLTKAALSSNAWVAVGVQNGNQAGVVTLDRGTTWQVVDFGGTPGHLTDVAASDAGFVVVGYSAGGVGLARQSADGVHWGPTQLLTGVHALSAVTCRNLACVAGGDGSALGNGLALHSLDGGASWAPTGADIASPQPGNVVYTAANSNDVFVLAGYTASGTPATLSSASGPKGPYVEDAPSPSYISYTGVAFGNGRWVAVGSDGANPFAAACSVAQGNAFAAPSPTGGTGELYDVAWLGNHWAAVGTDGSGNGVLATSPDGTVWTTSQVAGTQTLRGIAVGD